MNYVTDATTGALSNPRGKSGVQFILAGAIDSLGNVFPLDSAAVVPGYDASGNMITETASFGGSVWVRTYTWTNGVFFGSSQWVKQ